MSLTDRQKDKVEKAFLNVESKEEMPTCIALRNEDGKNHTDNSPLAQKYAWFFDQEATKHWSFGNFNDQEIKNARLLMLATFYVLEGKI